MSEPIISEEKTVTIRSLTVRLDGRIERYTHWDTVGDDPGLWMHEHGPSSSHSIMFKAGDTVETAILRDARDPECYGRSSFIWVDSGPEHKVHAIYRQEVAALVGEPVTGLRLCGYVSVTGTRVSQATKNKCLRCSRW